MLANTFNMLQEKQGSSTTVRSESGCCQALPGGAGGRAVFSTGKRQKRRLRSLTQIRTLVSREIISGLASLRRLSAVLYGTFHLNIPGVTRSIYDTRGTLHQNLREYETSGSVRLMNRARRETAESTFRRTRLVWWPTVVNKGYTRVRRLAIRIKNILKPGYLTYTIRDPA